VLVKLWAQQRGSAAIKPWLCQLQQTLADALKPCNLELPMDKIAKKTANPNCACQHDRALPIPPGSTAHDTEGGA
jgi:hypothetical protein